MLTKITLEWKNGDRRTFENENGLAEKELKQARRVVSENLPDDPEKKKKAEKATK